MPFHVPASRRLRTYASLASTLLACSSPARAEWTLGAGIGRTTDPLISDVNSAYPFPIIGYRGERWNLTLGEVSYKLRAQPGLEVSVLAGLRTADIDDPLIRDDDEEAKRAFAGIDRDLAADLGVTLVLPYELPLVIDVRHDVSDAKAGGAVTVMAPIPLLNRGPFSLALAVGGRWVTEEYIDYNYGVRPEEARAGAGPAVPPARPAYSADRGSFIAHAGIEIGYQIGEHWLTTLSLSYERLDEQITSSPLVEDDHVLDAGIALLYRF